MTDVKGTDRSNHAKFAQLAEIAPEMRQVLEGGVATQGSSKAEKRQLTSASMGGLSGLTYEVELLRARHCHPGKAREDFVVRSFKAAIDFAERAVHSVGVLRQAMRIPEKRLFSGRSMSAAMSRATIGVISSPTRSDTAD